MNLTEQELLSYLPSGNWELVDKEGGLAAIQIQKINGGSRALINNIYVKEYIYECEFKHDTYGTKPFQTEVVEGIKMTISISFQGREEGYTGIVEEQVVNRTGQSVRQLAQEARQKFRECMEGYVNEIQGCLT